MSEQNIKTKRCFDADIDEALRIIWINRKKEKAIKNMNSMQRKLHQRQFAVIHFLVYGIEKFISNILCDDSMSIGDIIIVYESKTKYAAECLRKHIQTLISNRPDTNIKLYSKDEFRQFHKSNLVSKNEYIIYIGDFSESKSISNYIVNWKFNQFGFRYGWIGQNAVISFVRKPTSEEFSKMVSIAETEFIKTKYEIDMFATLEGDFWDELSTPQKVAIGGGAVALVLLGVGGVAATVAENKKSLDKNCSDSQLGGRIDFLSVKEIEILKQKNSMDEITDEEWEYMNDVSPEYAEEWLDRDEDLRDMSLEVYDELRDFSDYSGIDFDEVVDLKW